MYRELCHVFPDVDLSSCLAVATSQRANMDLVSIGDRVEIEKLRLLNSVSAILFLLSFPLPPACQCAIACCTSKVRSSCTYQYYTY